MWLMLVVSVAQAAPSAGVYAALDAALVGGGAALGEALVGEAFREGAFTVGGFGSQTCPLDLFGEPRPCEDGAFTAVGLGAGGLGGAVLAGLPVRVRPWRVALGAAIPAVAGLGLVAAGNATDDASLVRAGVGTVAIGTPIATAVAAATDREDTAGTAPAVGVGLRPGGGTLTVAGRF